MHQVGERGPVPNDFEVVRDYVLWVDKAMASKADARVALDRIEAEVERLREALKEIANEAGTKAEDGSWGVAMHIYDVARSALAEEKVH
jgi:hypothetical protein